MAVNRLRIRVSLFNLYIVLITIFKGFGIKGDNVIYIAAFAVGVCAVFMKMIRESYTRREFCNMFFVVTLGLLCLVIGKETTVLFTAIAICGMKNIDCEKIIKDVLWIRITTFLIMVTLSSFGVIENDYMLFNRSGEEVYRYMFGYDHPNMAHMSLTIIILLYLYVYDSQLQWFHYLGALMISVVFYHFTYSRTGLILSVVSVVISAIQRKQEFRIGLMWCFKHAYVLLFAFTLLSGLLYGHVGALEDLNELMTGRIEFNHALLTSFFPPIIGSSVYNQTITFDNGYLTMLYQGGIVAFLWFSYYIVKTMDLLFKEGKNREFFLMVNFIVYSITESFFPSISVNISLIFLGNVLFKKGHEYGHSANNIYPNI